MHGSGETAEHSMLLRQKLNASRVGMRWQRILRAHRHELDGLTAIHPDLRLHVATALKQLAALDEDSQRLDESTLGAAERVLEDLERLGSFDLKRSAGALREELGLAHGRSLADVLA